MGDSTQGARFEYCWVVLAVGTLAVAGALGFGRFGYTSVLPAMQQDLHMTNTQTGGMASINLAGYLILSVLGGALSSKFGARRVVTAGLAVAGVGMILTGVADSFHSAAAWRGITGMGSGAANVSVMGMWAAWFQPRRRGMAAGIAVTGSSLALIVIGPLAPYLLAHYGEAGWRVCWFVYGTVTLFFALAALLFIKSRPPASVNPSLPDPALQWGLVYRSAAVWRLGLVYTAFGFSYIIYVTFFVKRLISEGGYSREAAGELFMTMGWASLLCGVIWGSVSDVIGRRRALVIVYLLHAAAFAIFALMPGVAGFTASALIFGISAWSIPAIMAATCGDVLGPRLAPAALGFITLFFGLGQAVAPGVAGALADAAGSFVPAYLIAAFVALAGSAGAVMLKPSSTGAPVAAVPGGETP